MINLLVVDDEPLMREGLSCIPWKSIGVNLIGTVSSGMEALTIIRNNPIQILFTDIQMPEISGLELIRAALIINPSIRSVVLTGHNRFEYAKEAISLHVYDYILKPCDPDNVLTIIGNLASDINREMTPPSPQTQFGQKSKNTLQSILQRIFTNQTMFPEDGAFLQQLGFLKDQSWFIACCTCTAADYLTVTSLILSAEHTGFMIYLIPLSPASFTLLLCTDNAAENLLTTGTAWLKSIQQTLIHQSITLKIAAGHLMTGPQDLIFAYTHALECSDYFFSHEETIFLSANQIQSQPDNISCINEFTAQILSYTEQMNYQCTEEALFRLETFLSSAWIKTSQIRTTVINLYLLASGLIAQKKKKAVSGLTAEQLLFINQSVSLSSLFAQTREYYKLCIDFLNNAANAATHHLAKECFEYIEKHYMENINVTQAAAIVHANPDYLSRILKKEYGLPFSQILTNYRLEKSCSLLSDPSLSISEISLLAGFSDFRYFGQVFKARYKMTPREYRKHLKRKE